MPLPTHLRYTCPQLLSGTNTHVTRSPTTAPPRPPPRPGAPHRARCEESGRVRRPCLRYGSETCPLSAYAALPYVTPSLPALEPYLPTLLPYARPTRCPALTQLEWRGRS
eukprot:1660252-Rhodomonas_salina.1